MLKQNHLVELLHLLPQLNLLGELEQELGHLIYLEELLEEVVPHQLGYLEVAQQQVLNLKQTLHQLLQELVVYLVHLLQPINQPQQVHSVQPQVDWVLPLNQQGDSLEVAKHQPIQRTSRQLAIYLEI